MVSLIEMPTSENVLPAKEIEADIDNTDEPTYENTTLFGKSIPNAGSFYCQYLH